jgi:hypothetical protein
MILIERVQVLPFHVTLRTLGTRERVTVYWEFPIAHEGVSLTLTLSMAVDITSWS